MTTRAVPTAIACAALAACSLDPVGKDRCEIASDCLAGHVCAQHVCVAEGNPPGGDAPPDAAVTASGSGFRVAAVRLPLTADARADLGLDLDRDPARTIDNRWDGPLRVVSDLGWYSQGGLDEQLAGGQLAIHGELMGADQAILRLRAGATLLGELVGAREGSRLTLGPGSLTVPLALLTGLPTPATVELVGARVEIGDADAGPGGWRQARLGGGVRLDVLRTALPAALEAVLADVVAIDCTGAATACCRDGSSGQRLVRELDRDGDCAITAAEIAAHPDVTALGPDLDLLDATGAPAPRADGAADCVSIGIGFATAPATFDLPP